MRIWAHRLGNLLSSPSGWLKAGAMWQRRGKTSLWEGRVRPLPPLSGCPSVWLQGPSERAGGGALASQELLPLLPLQARHVERPQQEATQGLAPRARPEATDPPLHPPEAGHHRCPVVPDLCRRTSVPARRAPVNEPQLFWEGGSGEGESGR